ncbi:MAG: repressor LexA [Acidobacteria bacterium 13_1_40CM_2_68_5]|nr:MAG: repressor LexA [Acidobacteria bacterium 13_1_40CM_2_68_5]
MLPTHRQREILEAIRSHVARHGRAPTLLEIARRVGLASISTVHKHLELLEERGLVRRRRKGRRQTIDLLPQARRGSAVDVPLLGRIAAGRPIEAIADERAVPLSREFVAQGRTYVLEVKGDSMVQEQILDGDYVVVEDRRTPKQGEVVVALIDGREATLKTFRRDRGRVRLQPANPSMEPIFVRPESLQIQGVVRGVLRRYA